MSSNVPRRLAAARTPLLVLFPVVLSLGALAISFRAGAQPQPFSSGSTGSDGALNVTAPGVTYNSILSGLRTPRGGRRPGGALFAVPERRMPR
jgi:hypothetical protein